MHPVFTTTLARIRGVDWRGIRAHLDPRLLKQRSRWVWDAGCAMVLLSLLGSWTLPWDSTVQVGSYYTSDYVYTYYNNETGDNAFHTVAFLLVIPAVAVGLAWAALKPWPEGPAWLRQVPLAVLALLGVVFVWYAVKAMLDANELIEVYAATNTSFPGGVGFCLVGILVMAWGARKVSRARTLEAGAPTTPPVAPPSAPPVTPSA